MSKAETLNEELNEEMASTEKVEDTNTTDEATETKVDAPEEIDWAAKVQEQKDKYLRLYADFDNYKKRTAKERLELISSASKDLIVELLPVLDDFERALKSAESSEEVKSVVEGMTLINNKLNSVMQKRQVVKMETIGTAFDAEQHEAITEIPAPDETMKGKVIDEIEKGYKLGDKIIRFPKVVVGK